MLVLRRCFVIANSKNSRRNSLEIAKNIFNLADNRIKLIISVVICAVITVLFWLFSDLVMIILDIIGNVAPVLYSLLPNIVFCLILLFFAAPVYMGTFRLALKMLECKQTNIVDIFDTFSSGRAYRRALGLSVALFLRILPMVLIIRAPWILEYISTAVNIPDTAFKVVQAAFVPVALVLVIAVSSSFGFVSFAYMDETVSIREAVKAARKARKGSYKSVYAMAYGTLIKLLVSLLTLGVLTVVHTAPIALLSYGAMAQELKNKPEIKPERNDI